MRRHVTILTIVMIMTAMCFSGITVFAGTFEKINTYDANFKDVKADKWYTPYIERVYEYGLMNGVNEDYFDVNGKVTIAQAITMADRLHSIYNEDGFKFERTKPWYNSYAES